MQTVQTAGNKETKMKTNLWLLLIAGVAFSSATVAQEKTRSHIKCYLQLEDKSKIVHHFVNTGGEDKLFIASLTERSVFMADGVSEQKIISVYECVALKNSFKNKDAKKVEKDTPF